MANDYQDLTSQLYQEYLGRAPEEGIAERWSAVGGTEADIRNALAASEEFQSRAGVVDLYQNVLGRAPEAEGLGYWASKFGSTIDPNEIQAFTAAAQAERPGAFYKPTTSIDYGDLTNRLYQEYLGRAPEANVAKEWFKVGASEQDIVNAIAASDEYQSRLNTVSLYDSILGRDPKEEEIKFWSSKFGPTLEKEEAESFLSAAKEENPNAKLPPWLSPLESRPVDTRVGTYDANILLTLASQIAQNIGEFKGGVFGETRPGVGFSYDEAKAILGRDPSTAEQVILDMARGLADKGVTDVNQLTTKGIYQDVQVRPIYDDMGQPTGRYTYSRPTGYGEDSYENVELTPQQIKSIYEKQINTGEGFSSVPYANLPIQQAIYSADKLLTSGFGNNVSMFLGETYSGPGKTSYTLVFNPETGKPQFNTIGSDTGSNGLISMALTAASFIPAVAPFAQAASALWSIQQGNILGGVASLASLGGFQNVSTALNVANAVKNNNPIALVWAVMNNPNMPKSIGDTKLAENITVKDSFNAITLVDAINKGDIALATLLAGQLTGSKDLQTAGAAARVMSAIQSGNPMAATNAAAGLKNAIDSSQNITNPSVASNMAAEVINAKSGEETVWGATYREAIANGATPYEAENAANTIAGVHEATTSPVSSVETLPEKIIDGVKEVDISDFAGFDQAIKDTIERNVLKIGNAEADSLEEAAALAGARGYSNFSYAGNTYSVSAGAQEIARQAAEQKIASQSTFSDAYKVAREQLGAGKVFEWNGNQYSTDTRAENPELAAKSDAIRNRLAAGDQTVTPEEKLEVLKSTPTQPEYSGPRIFGVPIGTPQDALNTVNRMGEVVRDFSVTMGKGYGNVFDFIGTVGHIVSTAIAGGDPKEAAISRDNALSMLGRDISRFYSTQQTEQSKQEQQNIISDIKNAPEYLKPFVAITSSLKNPGGAVSFVGEELGEEMPALASGLAIGQTLLKYTASGLTKSVTATTFLGDLAESAAGSFNNVSKNLQDRPDMTEQEKFWAATQASAGSMLATGVFGYGANAYLAKSLTGEITGPAAQKVLGAMGVEYVTEFPETLAQELNERYAEKNSVTLKDLSNANTNASLSALIGAKTSGSLVGTVEVMGKVSNGFVNAPEGDKQGIAIVQNENGETALVPNQGLEVGQKVNIDNLPQLQTPEEVVGQFNFSQDEASRITESVQHLVDTRGERKAQSEQEALSFDPNSVNPATVLESIASAQSNLGSTSQGNAVTTTSDGNTTVSTTFDPETQKSTTTQVDNQTGVITETSTTPESQSKTVIDPNNNISVKTEVDTQTNVQTTTVNDVNTNTLTKTVVDPNTNIATEVEVQQDTNITTQVTTDNNANTQTTVVTDPNTNTQTTVTVDTNTGTVVEQTTTDIPEDWTPPKIEPPPSPKQPPKKPKVTEKIIPRKKKELFSVPGGSEFISDYELTFKDPFISSLMRQEEFKGSLDPFLAQVSADDYAKMEIEDILRQQDLTQGQEMSNYFTYGVPIDINEIFNLAAQFLPGSKNQEAEVSTGLMAKGGLATPLMAYGGATGGLPMVAHSGKARVDFRHGAAVSGPGDGQSDDIPAMLADGEFVFPADVVAALGNGSTKAGSEKLYDMMHSIRAHHRSTGPKDLPPPAKSPLDYLKKNRKARR